MRNVAGTFPILQGGGASLADPHPRSARRGDGARAAIIDEAEAHQMIYRVSAEDGAQQRGASI